MILAADSNDERRRGEPVICPFDFAIVPGIQAEASLATLRTEFPGSTPVIFGSLAKAADMYYAHNYRDAKDAWDACSLNLYRAIEVAKRLGLTEDAERLSTRWEHCHAVWDSQFRSTF